MVTKKINQMFSGEKYSCICCSKDITRDEVKDWKCIHCNSKVIIKNGYNQYLVRKLPTEINIDDSIFVRGTGLFHKIYMLDIDYANNKCSVNLKEHRNLKYDDEWINVEWKTTK